MKETLSWREIFTNPLGHMIACAMVLFFFPVGAVVWHVAAVVMLWAYGRLKFKQGFKRGRQVNYVQSQSAGDNATQVQFGNPDSYYLRDEG